jgi:methyltransferase (TIGR00027 family)
VVPQRAVLTAMGVLDDPFAHGMLTPSMEAIVRLVRRWPAPFRARSVTLAGFAARVLWFDAQVTDALDAGIEQVAVIGAGYDSRAWRFQRHGVQFFELDHRATQQDKMRRAPGPGPIYVEADLTTEDAAEALLAQGLDASRPALFVVEGLTMYLSEQVLGDQLRGLATSTADDSRLAVEFHPPRETGTSRNRRQRLLQQLARVGSGEYPAPTFGDSSHSQTWALRSPRPWRQTGGAEADGSGAGVSRDCWRQARGRPMSTAGGTDG